MTREAFVPPKPNEFDIAMATARTRDLLARGLSAVCSPAGLVFAETARWNPRASRTSTAAVADVLPQTDPRVLPARIIGA
jgi:hypothetical protein